MSRLRSIQMQNLLPSKNTATQLSGVSITCINHMVEDTLEKWTLVNSSWLERNISVDWARRTSAWYDGMSFTTMASELPHEIEAKSQLASPSKP